MEKEQLEWFLRGDRSVETADTSNCVEGEDPVTGGAGGMTSHQYKPWLTLIIVYYHLTNTPFTMSQSFAR